MALLIGGTLSILFIPYPWWVLAIALLVGVEVLEIMLWLRLRKRVPASGIEGLIGRTGQLIEGGRVRIAGTTYRAKVLEGEPGDPVVVESVDNITLRVRRAAPPG